ncbi:acyl carrier protein [Kitasatospora sp. GP82]|nr:acyl carrier protein [Kitasatospora sp. GP82]MDH6127040.1 acyl carrier protein [Kitasatospora sp. GP82]
MTLSTTNEQILRDSLAQAAVTDVTTIPHDGHLEQDLGIDSLALHELIVILENKLAVAIPDEEVGRLTTIGGIRSLLVRLQPLSSGTDTP